MILRGQLVNPWELRPWERLADRFDVSVLVPHRHPQALGDLGISRVRVRTLSDLVPTRRASQLAAPLPVNRYLGLQRQLHDAAIVHGAELHPWFTAQAAGLRPRGGFRLVSTVWETIPFRSALRHPLSRRNRKAVLAATDLFLAATERARTALLLEGVAAHRVRVVEPGVDLSRFATAKAGPMHDDDPLVISPGRLVWEKGHQDVLRAVAALRGGVVEGPRSARRIRALILGSGPEERTLRSYAADLGVSDAVEFCPSVPYEEMPEVYARASAMVLASLPIQSWEEQFGMVLAEAMAAGVPIVTTSSGAIPEVVGPEAVQVAPGDWVGIAQALADGPLVEPGRRVVYQPERLERFGTEAAAERIAGAYEHVLAAGNPAPNSAGGAGKAL